MKKRLALIAAFQLFLGSLGAQERVSSFSVATDYRSARIKVDGQEYRGSATFLWPEGSKHVVEFELRGDGYQYDDVGSTRYGFVQWAIDGAQLPQAGSNIVTVTANPAVSSLRATLNAEYQVKLLIFEGPASVSPVAAGCATPGNIPSSEFRPGVVHIDDLCFWNNVVLWLLPGLHSLAAFPYPGFVFDGWTVDNSGLSAFVRSFEVHGPMTVAPRFAPGKRMKFLTDPPGLKVLVDRTETPTPELAPCEANLQLPPAAPRSIAPLCIGEFDWALGSRHVIAAPTPQSDKFGRYWTFNSFSDGSAQNAIYTVTSLSPPETLTARFVRGAQVSFLTQPTGLKLRIDGRDNWPSYNFVWGVGSSYDVVAPSEQVDSKGRRYVFKGWSNGGAAAQQVTVPEEAATSGLRLIAAYELLSQVTIHSSPGGTPVEINGTSCNTPCVQDHPDGTEIRVVAPLRRVLSDAHRLEFSGWSDGASRDRTITLGGAEPKTVTAAYTAAYRLQASSEPAGGARFLAEPASADGHYAEGTSLTIAVEAERGYRFRRWSGDLDGTSRIATLAMSRPRAVVALLDRVPFIAPAGVRNAAGDTPDKVVSPGSIVSIYGANLAPYPELGPVSPLAQTLAGVTVHVSGRILPLLYVSPEQINALIPSDLPEGAHRLTVSWSGQPDVVGEFTAVRNAPGLFSRTFLGKLFTMAAHEDGSPLTPENPARRGETITVYGTGFGPYRLPPPDGFPLPAAPEFTLADEVVVLAGDLEHAVSWAGGAPGYSGMTAVRLRIGGDLPAASTLELRVRVNGRLSNTVLLPIE